MATVTEDQIRDLLGVQAPGESITWLNVLPYGDPGVGKTMFCGTAQDHPETSPALLLDVEGGSITLRRRADLDVVQIRTMKQIEDVHKHLFKQSELYYKTVIIDSLTELQKLDMRTVMQDQFNKKPDTTNIYVPSQREWGMSGERMRMIVRAFRDLPCNTIMTCLAQVEKDDKTSVTSYRPSLPGKLGFEIPGFFDIVGYMRAVDSGGDEGIIRTMQVAKTEKVVAKDRTDSLDQLIRSPSIPLMWEVIHSSNSDS